MAEQKATPHQLGVAVMRNLLPNFIIDWLVPLPIYFILLPLTNTITALAAAGAIPVVHTIVLYAWRRQLNWLGILAIIGFAGGLGAALLGGGTLSLKIYGPVITGALGVVFLISAAMKKPFLIPILKSFNVGDPERFTKKPWIYKRATLMTIGFGIVFFYDAFTHAILALTLPTDTYVVVDRVITLTTIVLLYIVVRVVILRIRPQPTG